ncbi:MAG: ImmA/IrrE family metallo-endopeptidase [Armatimonadetes bacterium]|nr:ImmA/IrrE family metallo-endopeptidase [Armatimonadota bacterium]
MADLYFTDDAERFAYKAWETLKLEPPVDVDRIAERLGVDLYREEFVEEIDGFYLRIPGAPPVVAINNSYIKPCGRQRFTSAHEIGHHLLCRRVKTKTRLFYLDSVRTRKTALERACDRFAALLLMPEPLVRQWFEDLSANPENRVAIMSERFGVSAWAMRVRLRELDLPYRRWDRRRRSQGLGAGG